ncbi:MAG: Rrf2 family transcriptional regulator [Candidatus Sumerlaeia bacterium]|nr:Rrf2 family transcriptional regulator [Candidatus Sumerlaeia bacterium]
MALTQKCLYALRALLELAVRHDQGPLRVSEIATAQDIPPRFLEVIMSELRQGGFVDSRRGKDGGYTLSRETVRIRLGDVIRYVDGSLAPVEKGRVNCPSPDCIFQPTWDAAEAALSEVYDNVTLQDIADRHFHGENTATIDFVI